MIRAPEMNAKPLGFIMLRDHERAEFDALSLAQKGYFLHWLRSNQRYNHGDSWRKAVRKAREQRPSTPTIDALGANKAENGK